MDALRTRALFALRAVIDPEVGLDIVTMGLVYGIEATPIELRLKMTLTTPGCPMGSALREMAGQALAVVAGERKVRIDLVFDPPWDPRMLTEEGRAVLRA